jgi:hypothetical protein
VSEDPFADAGEGWPVTPASPAAAAFVDLMTAALESIMVAQELRRLGFGMLGREGVS